MRDPERIKWCWRYCDCGYQWFGRSRWHWGDGEWRRRRNRRENEWIINKKLGEVQTRPRLISKSTGDAQENTRRVPRKIGEVRIRRLCLGSWRLAIGAAVKLFGRVRSAMGGSGFMPTLPRCRAVHPWQMNWARWTNLSFSPSLRCLSVAS